MKRRVQAPSRILVWLCIEPAQVRHFASGILRSFRGFSVPHSLLVYPLHALPYYPFEEDKETLVQVMC